MSAKAAREEAIECAAQFLYQKKTGYAKSTTDEHFKRFEKFMRLKIPIIKVDQIHLNMMTVGRCYVEATELISILAKVLKKAKS